MLHLCLKCENVQVVWVVYFPAKRVTQTVIAFMTDGQDTKCGQKDELAMAVQTWKAKLTRRDQPVVVHSIGFSRGKF